MLATQTLYSAIRFNNTVEEAAPVNIRRILLAEDDDDDFNIFNSALLSVQSSLEVLRTKNGIMFSSLLETSIKPDLIILDLNMPLKNGISCLHEIKSRTKFNSTRVGMYSTSSFKKEIDICYELGADFYLVKPICYASIIEQLKDLFRNEYFIKKMRPPRNKFVFNSNWLYNN